MQGERVTGLFVGRSTLDLVYACQSFPEPDGKVDAASGYFAAGGPALNAAITFAGLGGRARLLTVIGEGAMAARVREELASAGVELIDAAAGEADALPVSSVILTGASRAVVNLALPARRPEPGRELLDQAWAEPPDIVLSDGQLPELAVPMLRRARAAGVHTVLDGGSRKPWTDELCPSSTPRSSRAASALRRRGSRGWRSPTARARSAGAPPRPRARSPRRS
jgi:sugar/nucleoside kinase (ribokinase family)